MKIYFLLLFSIVISFTSCKTKWEKEQERLQKEKVKKVFETFDETLKERGQPITTNPTEFQYNDSQFNKPNDIIVAVVNNPHANGSEIASLNLTKANTCLFTEEFYKTRKFIKDRFTVNGQFDHERFHYTYIRAFNIYQELP